MPDTADRRRLLIVWGAGLALGLVTVGPGLGSGALLNLDLVATDHWPAPRSFWGVGPELARAVPFEMGLSAIASMIGGSAAVKAFFVVAIAAAFAGAHRLAEQLGAIAVGAWSAALLYGASPFLLTRVGVGHLTMVGAMALLPFVHRRLLQPGDDPRRTLLAAAAMATMGFYGGLLTALCVGAGLAVERGRHLRVVAPAVALSQLVWLVPGAVMLAGGPDLGDGSNFPSGLSTWAAPARILTGHGFWQERFQVGAEPDVLTSVLAVGIVGAIVVAARAIDRTWFVPAVVAAAIASMIMLADATPGVDAVFDAVTALPGLSSLREPQRLLPPVVLLVAIGLPIGAERVASMIGDRWGPYWQPSLHLAPLAVAIVLGAPGLWGIDGQLRPVTIPDAWHEARAMTTAEPGTVLALPWHRYQNSSIADGRRVLNPALSWFGPDVVTSNDLELDATTRETIDPRVAHLEVLLPAMRSGEPVAGDLAAVGIRWVVLLHDADYERYLPILGDPGLEHVLVDVSIDVLRVRPWTGPVVTVDGDAITIDRLGAPVARLGTTSTPSAVWAEPAAPGWMQGWNATATSPTGLVALPGGSRVVWFWPALVVLVGHLIWISAVTWVFVRRH